MARELTGPRVVVALDFPSSTAALALVDQLDPKQCRLKVGFELYVAAGPALLEQLHSKGFDVFLDLKFHDIPNTVASAVRAASEQGVWMLNVHASGGRRMITAAREAVEAASHQPLLIAVTVLTSMTPEDLQETGCERPLEEQVKYLATLAQNNGADGVVCSAREAETLRATCGSDFALVTPGIRPAGSAAGDQRRTMEPLQAVEAGSSFLVIGRPVTAAKDPLTALNEINLSLGYRAFC